MTRVGNHVGNARHQGHLVGAISGVVGSNTETLPTTSPNYSIVSDRTPRMMMRKPLGKTPLRAASCVFPRGRSLDSSPVLPDRAPDSRPPSPTIRKKEAYRAAERGRGNLLPTASFDLDAPLRARTSSMTSNGLRRTTSGAPTTLQEHVAPSSSVPHSLRNRRSTLQLQDEETSHPIVQDSPMPGQRGVQFTWSDTFGKTEKPQRRNESNYDFRQIHTTALLNAQHAFTAFNRGQLLQALIMLAVTCFVFDSYHKAMSTTEQLLIVKHDESMMLLHLKRLEDQAMHLHESVTRLSERGFDRTFSGHDGASSERQQHVDADLIKVQYDQLRQMEDELNHEVKSLQNKIRQTDRANIVRAYGEGPVQVTLEIDFATAGVVTGSSMISILLWYETPHAAWTLLDQIQRGVWEGARFEMDRGFAVVASPTERDSTKRLDFVEKGQKLHEPWTVGLTEAEDGELSLFINLQDNTQYHKHDVCIGKIIDGFDTLQRLTRAARNQQQHDVPVSIKKATASHLTRRESAGLI